MPDVLFRLVPYGSSQKTENRTLTWAEAGTQRYSAGMGTVSGVNYPERCGREVIIAPLARQQRSAASVTLHVHLQDRCVMAQAVDGCHRHGLVREHLIPLGERCVGRDGDALALIALTNQLEEHRCLGLVPLGIAEVVKHQQVEATELGQLGRQPQIAACCLQALHQFAGAAEQHLVAPLDKSVANASHKVRLASARRTEGQQVVPLRDPAVGFGQCHDMGLGDGWHGREVELAEALARRQLAACACARQSPCLALGHLVLQPRPQKALRWPALVVGLLGQPFDFVPELDGFEDPGLNTLAVNRHT